MKRSFRNMECRPQRAGTIFFRTARDTTSRIPSGREKEQSSGLGEATRRLKQDPATEGIPIIALTAMAFAEDEARANAAGCDGYIRKPADPLLVVDAVQRMMRSPHPG